jgi:tRNA(fMet)-specific endonuclease VapC
MLLLDTNTLSEFFKDHPKILARMNAVPDDEPVVTSIISRIEILEGRFASIKKAANHQELLIAASRLKLDEEKLATIDILPVTKAVADQFEAIVANKKLKKIGRADLLIACIALAHGATLVTRNTKDFASVPGLKTENWAD